MIRCKILITTVLLATAAIAGAEPLRTYIGSFNAVGTPNGAELKTLLPALLLSRLDPEVFTAVDRRDAAEAEITGSYVVFGKTFTLDATVKTIGGNLLAKGFEQGEREDDAPAALGKLAATLGKGVAAGQAKVATARQPQPAIAPAAPSMPVTQAAADQGRLFRETWNSSPLDGALVAIACGKKLPSGERELFVASNRALFYYRLGNELKKIATAELPANTQIIALDAADIDNDGNMEIFVTAIDRETLASRVLTTAGDSLKTVAADLPYYFRSLTLSGSDRKIYAQQMSMESDFYGPVSEVVKSGDKFTTIRPLRLPENANIYTVSSLKQGTDSGFTVISSEGLLTALAPNGEQLWQSSDRFGGSETHFKREAEPSRSSSGDGFRWIFLQQRLYRTADGALLLPRNDGAMVAGNMRSFSKHSFHLLQWSGATFRELGQSSVRPGYLADYCFDPSSGELITLEVTQKEGLLTRGKSAISVVKVAGY
ncbi:MAG: VCBS repeat-containing protein [Geobacter sp.]|nr:VCBS repeat-containing protein [Geobacter sp.]